MRIIINGAGIAGPTLAYWLRRAGQEGSECEDEPDHEQGAQREPRELDQDVEGRGGRGGRRDRADEQPWAMSNAQARTTIPTMTPTPALTVARRRFRASRTPPISSRRPAVAWPPR